MLRKDLFQVVFSKSDLQRNSDDSTVILVFRIAAILMQNPDVILANSAFYLPFSFYFSVCCFVWERK